MLPFTIISIPFLSSFLIELLLMVHNNLKSDGNYLTGAIPSEVQALFASTENSVMPSDGPSLLPSFSPTDRPK